MLYFLTGEMLPGEVEEISKVLNELRREEHKILVEGLRDERCLVDAGISREMIIRVAQMSPEKIQKLREIYINLIDDDITGKKTIKRLRQLGVRMINKYRIIFNLIRSPHLEDLKGILKEK